MRPAILNDLFSSVMRLKGVGENVRQALARLVVPRFGFMQTQEGIGGPYIRDMLFHLPSGIVDRRFSPALNGPIPDGSIITVTVKVMEHQTPPRGTRGKRPYKVLCSNATGDLFLIFFNARPDYLAKLLPVGRECVVSGKVERFDYHLQMAHPDRIGTPAELRELQRIEPVYPLTYAMSNRQLGKIIAQAVALAPALPEWIDPAMLTSRGWLGWQSALRQVHAPQSSVDLEAVAAPRQRLAYDEILANQLALALVRRGVRKQPGIKLPCHPRACGDLRQKGQPPEIPGQARDDKALVTQVISALPFALTHGQRQVLEEIDADLSSGHRMLRLLQGDVGSGKTVIALLTMLRAVDAGKQAAMMVPTEIVARQHLAFIRSLVSPLGLRVELLSGSIKGAERAALLRDIENGEVQLIIGTHAVFQEKVIFRELALTVIDEQHRFGVAQRLALAAKGEQPHILLMTATPIPRSLAMTAFGDMDCSLLTEKPAGRKPIDTRTIPLVRADEVVQGLKRATASGSKAYWICPLVEEQVEEEGISPQTDLAAAEGRYREFVHVFGERVALVHGRMKGEERERIIAGFAGDQYDVLVATTVVEVGVNVPEATIMVIEHAERFGLAQLHQLRGRVGRGDKPSSCLLLFGPRLSETAKSRLKILRESDDGFRIAEEDLRLRGSGEILGTRQSGLPQFYFADLATHGELISAARQDVAYVLERDSALASERGKALQLLLYLFSYDEGIRVLESG